MSETTTGNIGITMSVQSQQAMQSLGKVQQKMEGISKAAKEAAKNSKEIAGFGRGIGAQASGMLGQFGLGGITLGAGLGTAIGSGIFAISELLISKMNESNRRLIEGLRRGDDKMKSDIDSAKGIKGLSQQDVMNMSGSYGVSIAAIKAVANELGISKFSDKSKMKPLLTSVDYAMRAGTYREGFAKELYKFPIDPRTPDEAINRSSGWIGKPGKYSYDMYGRNRIASYSINSIKEDNASYVEKKSAEYLRFRIAEMLEGGISAAYDDAEVNRTHGYVTHGTRKRLESRAMAKFREYREDPTKLIEENWFYRSTMEPTLREMVENIQDVAESNREMLKKEANSRFTYQSSETTGDGK
jgi:hypothetical protein